MPDIKITFDKKLTKSTVTINSANDDCSASIRLKNQRTNKCVALTDLTFSPGRKTIQAFPKVDLKTNSTYEIVVTKEVTATDHSTLNEKNSSSFTTTAGDGLKAAAGARRPTIDDDHITPNGISVPKNSKNIAIDFTVYSEGGIDPETIKINTENDACKGNVKIYQQNPANTCLPFSGKPGAEAGFTQFTFNLKNDFSGFEGKTFVIHVDDTIKDKKGLSLARKFYEQAFTIEEDSSPIRAEYQLSPFKVELIAAETVTYKEIIFTK